jgi:hypothetical protein
MKPLSAFLLGCIVTVALCALISELVWRSAAPLPAPVDPWPMWRQQEWNETVFARVVEAERRISGVRTSIELLHKEEAACPDAPQFSRELDARLREVEARVGITNR